MLKHKLVDFIIQFMEEVDKEISEMKLFVSDAPPPPPPAPGYGSELWTDMLRLVKRKGQICCRVVPDARKSPPISGAWRDSCLTPYRLVRLKLPRTTGTKSRGGERQTLVMGTPIRGSRGQGGVGAENIWRLRYYVSLVALCLSARLEPPRVCYTRRAQLRVVWGDS